MGKLLCDYAVKEVNPKVNENALKTLFSFIEPRLERGEHYKVICPVCSSNSDHYLGTGFIQCDSCGIVGFDQIYADHYDISQAEALKSIANKVGIKLPIDILSEISPNSRLSFLDAFVYLARLETLTEYLETIGLKQEDIDQCSRLCLITDVEKFKSQLVELVGYIPKPFHSILEDVKGEVFVIRPNRDRRLSVIKLNGYAHQPSVVSEFGSGHNGLLYITDDPLLSELLISRHRRVQLVNTHLSSHYLYSPKFQSRIGNREVIAVWQNSKSQDIPLPAGSKVLSEHWYHAKQAGCMPAIFQAIKRYDNEI